MIQKVLLFAALLAEAHGLTQDLSGHAKLRAEGVEIPGEVGMKIQGLITSTRSRLPAFFFKQALDFPPIAELAPQLAAYVLVWHLIAVCAVVGVLALVLMTRKRRRLQLEDDANVKSGLALLWALSGKDISSRLSYFTKRKPREVLLSYGAQKLSVQEFDEMTLKGATALLHGLIARGEIVIVCMPRSVDFYTIVVACLRSGHVFVPVSPEVARDAAQMKSVIAQSGATVMITSESLYAEFKKMGSSTLKTRGDGAGKVLKDLRTVTVGDVIRPQASDAKDAPRIRAPKGGDSACMIFTSEESSAPACVSFSHQNITGMIDSWLQSGLHSKAAATAFGNHTDMVGLSYALGTLCAGGRFVVPVQELKPSPKALDDLGVTHGLISDDKQAIFDWSAKAADSMERTLFVTMSTAAFCDDANKHGLKVRALYSTPIHACGVAGIATKLVVHRDELLAYGAVKHLSLATKVKQKTKVGKQADVLTFVSSGLPHDNVDVMIRRNEQCVEDDIVGEILIRSAIQATSKDFTPDGLAGFKSTGDFGFVSSSNYQLYITAGQGDRIMLGKKCVKAAELECAMEKQYSLVKAAIFTVEARDNSTKIVLTAEMKDSAGNAKATVAGLQKFAQQQKMSLDGIVLLSPGGMPMLHGSSVVSRGAAKMKYLEGKLSHVLDGMWRAPENTNETSHAVDANLDDVESVTFAPGGNGSESEGRAFRKKEILAAAVEELKKMGVSTSVGDAEWLLSSQQMALATKRFERMLSTPDAVWTKFGVQGDVAPWSAGVCMNKTVELKAMMFLETEGNTSKILDRLERVKFPSAKDAAAVVKADPKLAPAQYEGEPMSIMTYRALETLGSCSVALVMGIAVAGAVQYYNWLYTFAPASAFSATFPMFLNIFTVLCIALKWIVIGKYKPGALARYSSAYFRWWFMDRLIETWEGWVALWFPETIFLNLIYKLFGANIDWSTNMATMIREFDLIEIGADADISGELFPRIVTKDGVIMHKISIGEAAKIDSKGYLPPNTTVEAGATVDKCEVVKSGTTVKAPAVPRVADRAAGIRLEIMQYILQLCGGVLFMGKFISPHATALATSVRMYEPVWLALGANSDLQGPIFIDALRWVTYYMVFLWTLGFLLTALCVVMKWCMFGRLKDGHRTGGIFWDLRVYILNWWWMLANMFFISYWVDCSLLSITMYNLFGANVSYRTGLRFMQNMSPHHADFMTIKDGSNMSNAKLHPSTAADRNLLKNVVLEEGAFVGLMSIVQGGVTVGKNSSVATTTRCTSSVAPGTNLIGTMVQKQQPQKAASAEMDLASIGWHLLALDLLIAMVLKVGLMAGYIIGLTFTVATSMYAYEFLPFPLVIVVAALSLAFFLGVVYGKSIEVLLHPRREAELHMGEASTRLWLQYLQGLYLSQNYTFSMINGSWMAAWFHRMLGAETPLDAQWYTLTIRDQCLLSVGHDAVIDRDAYMVGHVGQPGGVLSFQRARLGDGAQLHPKSILLSGQRLEDNATLDFYSHSHLEKSVPEGKFYSGNPASSLRNGRVEEIATALPVDQ